MSKQDESKVAVPSGGSPSLAIEFRPTRDPVTNADMVARNPAPNASAPAVPSCIVTRS